MAHNISALILKGEFNKETAYTYDLKPVPLGYRLTLFHIEDYYTAYWQYRLNIEGMLEITFPKELSYLRLDKVVVALMQKITRSQNPLFAFIHTDYFGGFGYQFAQLFEGYNNISDGVSTVNQALKYLGVEADKNTDEFDSVNLGSIRNTAEYLEKYVDLCDSLGI